jgi:molybdopterin-binding protein
VQSDAAAAAGYRGENWLCNALRIEADFGKVAARLTRRALCVLENYFIQKEVTKMKYGARNTIRAKVKSVKKGDIMALVKFEVTVPTEMASVLTTESVDAMDLKPNDEIQLIIKAIHVLPVKE